MLGKLLADLLPFLRTSPAVSYRVEIIEDGRSGQVRYTEGALASVFYWEFGGGDTVACISVPTEQKWATDTPFPLERRGEIVQRVGSEVIRQRCPGCVAEEDRGWLNIRKAG